jgi:hypothetical protein
MAHTHATPALDLVGRCLRSIWPAGVALQHIHVVTEGSRDTTVTVVFRIGGVNPRCASTALDTGRPGNGSLERVIDPRPMPR